MAVGEIQVVPLEKSHIPELWLAVQTCSDFFYDNFYDYGDFSDYMLNVAAGVLVIVKEGQVLGCGYLEDYDKKNGFAHIAFFTKRKSLTPQESLFAAKSSIPYYFEKYELNTLYVSIKTTNKAMLKLAKALGFSDFQLLKNCEQAFGGFADYMQGAIRRCETT